MTSFGDDHDEIVCNLTNELTHNEIVITTGGLGPTKDDITKAALAEISGSKGYVVNEGQLKMVHEILHARGLECPGHQQGSGARPGHLRSDCQPPRHGADYGVPLPKERYGHQASLYALPGVPFEAVGAIPDVIKDVNKHNPLTDIFHKCVMVFGSGQIPRFPRKLSLGRTVCRRICTLPTCLIL